MSDLYDILFGEKQGRFITKDGKVIFIGGPSGGGGSSTPKSYSQETVNGALEFVANITFSSDIVSELTPEMKDFLSNTVTKDSYTAYRGLGIINERVTPEQADTLNKLSIGDAAPDFLAKKWNPYESWTMKKGVATSYASGRMSLVLESQIPRNRIVVDTSNLEKLLSGIEQTIFSNDDFDYFKQSKELITDGFPNSRILSISGKVKGK